MLDFLNKRKGTDVSSSTRLPVGDSLDAFGSEHSILSRRGSRAQSDRFPVRRTSVTVVAVVALIAIGVTGYFLRDWRPFRVEAASASLTIESVPAGAEVLSEGIWKGRTPLTLAVTPGEHSFDLMYEGRRKALRVVARSGVAVVHHVGFDVPPPPVPQIKPSSLRVTTQPPNLRVLIDGAPRGTSPLTLHGIEPGTHKVQVGTVERTVEVAAGESAVVILTAPAAPSGPAAGWLIVSAPRTLQIREGNEIIGTSAASKIMLPAGRHEIVLQDDAIGFSEKRIVHVAPGASASIKVDLPNAPLSINALPWAEVWLDGRRLGETPIGNVQVRLGAHEIIFRHPELGERRQTVTVTMNAPARVAVDMRKPGS